MYYISQTPTHSSKGNLECVLKCTKFPGKQASVYMSKKKCSSIEHWYKKLGDVFNKKRGKISTHALFLIAKY